MYSVVECVYQFLLLFKLRKNLLVYEHLEALYRFPNAVMTNSRKFYFLLISFYVSAHTQQTFLSHHLLNIPLACFTVTMNHQSFSQFTDKVFKNRRRSNIHL